MNRTIHTERSDVIPKRQINELSPQHNASITRLSCAEGKNIANKILFRIFQHGDWYWNVIVFDPSPFDLCFHFF